MLPFLVPVPFTWSFVGVLHNCMLDLRNCVLCLPVSGTVVCVALNINMQVLWLGKEDVNVTWEPLHLCPKL